MNHNAGTESRTVLIQKVYGLGVFLEKKVIWFHEWNSLRVSWFITIQFHQCLLNTRNKAGPRKSWDDPPNVGAAYLRTRQFLTNKLLAFFPGHS